MSGRRNYSNGNFRSAGRGGSNTTINYNYGRPPSRPASRPPSRPTSRPGTPSAINEPAPPKFVYSELTDQEKAEFESIKANAFKSACTLALLPGRIPMCFACGQCYVTDYFVWDKFWSNICYAHAIKKFLAAKKGWSGKAPFTWGLRPISAQKITPVHSTEGQSFVWTFITANIASYGAAKDFFARTIAALRDIDDKTPGTATAGSMHRGAKAALIRCMESGEMPSKAVMDDLTANIDIWSERMTPGELAIEFDPIKTPNPTLTNLKSLQQAEYIQDRIDTLRANLNAVESRMPMQRAQQSPQVEVNGDSITLG